MKIQKMISLDQETARLASQKTNFSNWVRDKLRSERNQREVGDFTQMKLQQLSEVSEYLDMSTHRLLYYLEQKEESEIKVLIQLLKNSVGE
tara:strand:- start:284 stop:556 length:273 start_codon:yes stop_codon:yes gene_type:complete